MLLVERHTPESADRFRTDLPEARFYSLQKGLIVNYDFQLAANRQRRRSGRALTPPDGSRYFVERSGNQLRMSPARFVQRRFAPCAASCELRAGCESVSEVEEWLGLVFLERPGHQFSVAS